jgi:hypothetical protein
LEDFRVAERRNLLRAPESVVDFAPLRFGPRRGGKTSKSERIPFAERNERFRDAGRKSLRSLGCEIGHFAELFVFNGLSPFSFRPNRKRHPGHMKTAAGLAVSSEKQ